MSNIEVIADTFLENGDGMAVGWDNDAHAYVTYNLYEGSSEPHNMRPYFDESAAMRDYLELLAAKMYRHYNMKAPAVTWLHDNIYN